MIFNRFQTKRKTTLVAKQDFSILYMPKKYETYFILFYFIETMRHFLKPKLIPRKSKSRFLQNIFKEFTVKINFLRFHYTNIKKAKSNKNIIEVLYFQTYENNLLISNISFKSRFLQNIFKEFTVKISFLRFHRTIIKKAKSNKI